MTEFIYVVIALEDGIVKECLTLESRAEAMRVFDQLKKIWGGANVCFLSRKINNVPANIFRNKVRQ